MTKFFKKHKIFSFIICLIVALVLYVGISFLTEKIMVATAKSDKQVTLDKTKTDEKFFLHDEDYEENMVNVVEPFVASYRQDGFVETSDGLEISYSSFLLPDSDKYVLMAHGFTETKEKYTEVIYYFLKEGFSVFNFDFRGHGYSERQVDDPDLVYVQDLNEYVEDMKTVLDKAVLPVVGDGTLYGYCHSMGGGVTAYFLEQYPDYFDKVVLTCPMLDPATAGIPKNITKLMVNAFLATGGEKKYVIGHYPFDYIEDFSIVSSGSEMRYSYYFDKMVADENIQTYGASYAWLNAALKGCKEILKKENAEKIKTPLLVFCAENDNAVGKRGIYRFVNEVDSASLIFVPNAKHELYSAHYETLVPYFNTVFEFFEN
ncbi:MAG: alpha/beta hydrolase [Lachnospiraceae bacterium]|nr:alpha/beta hydrolase [Lachnospiraceae bacterium]